MQTQKANYGFRKLGQYLLLQSHTLLESLEAFSPLKIQITILLSSYKGNWALN